MSDLVLFDRYRASLPGLVLPDPPPTRISIGGSTYKIVAPTSILPPLINTAKIILNWAGPVGKIAKNVFYILMGSGGGSTSDPVWLNALASEVMTAWGSASMNTNVHASWSLQSATAKDNGGTSAQSTSTGAPIPGGSAGTCHPPQVSVAVSWQIADSYRGGKPRLYLPGIPTSASASAGDSTILTSYASSVDAAATLFMSTINGAPVSGTTVTLGSVSHYTGHAVRPTPVFRKYLGVHVHERFDSQRRRSGKESTFPVTP